MTVQAGALRHRVVVEELTTVEGPLGPEQQWVDRGAFWCEVRSLSAGARADYQAIQHATSFELRFRYSATTAAIVPGTWRIREGNRTFLPTLPARDPDGRRREIIVPAEVQVS